MGFPNRPQASGVRPCGDEMRMDTTTIIASYAALVAGGAAAVQLAQWPGTRTQLKPEANAGIESEDRDVYGNEILAPGEVVFIQLPFAK
jgi:hypothetical protein